MRSLQPMPPTRTSRVAVSPSQRRLLLLPLRPEHHRLSDATNVLSPSGHLPLSWRPKEVEQVRRTTAATDSISRLIRSAIVAEGAAGSFRTTDCSVAIVSTKLVRFTPASDSVVFACACTGKIFRRAFGHSVILARLCFSTGLN